MATRNALRCVYEVAILRALRRRKISIRVAKICAYSWPILLSRRPQEQKWQHYATARLNEAGIQRRKGNFFEARLALLDARKALHRSRLLRRQT
jgi:hypothetical protein